MIEKIKNNKGVMLCYECKCWSSDDKIINIGGSKYCHYCINKAFFLLNDNSDKKIKKVKECLHNLEISLNGALEEMQSKDRPSSWSPGHSY